MSDLSLLRYGGFAGLPESGALRRRLNRLEQPEYHRRRYSPPSSRKARTAAWLSATAITYDPATPEPFADERKSMS